MCQANVEYVGTEDGFDVYRAEAACGWYGEDFNSYNAAAGDAWDHSEECPSEAYFE